MGNDMTGRTRAVLVDNGIAEATGTRKHRTPTLDIMRKAALGGALLAAFAITPALADEVGAFHGVITFDPGFNNSTTTSLDADSRDECVTEAVRIIASTRSGLANGTAVCYRAKTMTPVISVQCKDTDMSFRDQVGLRTECRTTLPHLPEVTLDGVDFKMR